MQLPMILISLSSGKSSSSICLLCSAGTYSSGSGSFPQNRSFFVLWLMPSIWQEYPALLLAFFVLLEHIPVFQAWRTEVSIFVWCTGFLQKKVWRKKVLSALSLWERGASILLTVRAKVLLIAENVIFGVSLQKDSCLTSSVLSWLHRGSNFLFVQQVHLWVVFNCWRYENW